MYKLKTGGASAAHAERSGSPSKNGNPTATAPATQECPAVDHGSASEREGTELAAKRGKRLDFTEHLRPCLRNASFLTSSVKTCLIEPSALRLTVDSALTSGKSLSTISRWRLKLASFLA